MCKGGAGPLALEYRNDSGLCLAPLPLFSSMHSNAEFAPLEPFSPPASAPASLLSSVEAVTPVEPSPPPPATPLSPRGILRSPRPATRRTSTPALVWRDESPTGATPLAAVRTFHEDDEPWRCGHSWRPETAPPALPTHLGVLPPLPCFNGTHFAAGPRLTLAPPPFGRMAAASSAAAAAAAGQAGPAGGDPAQLRLDPPLPHPADAAAATALAAAVARQKVAVESVAVRGGVALVTIRVANLAYNKTVFVRHTTDRWRTQRDAPATYAASTGGGTDRFLCLLPLPAAPLTPAAADVFAGVEFAVGFRADGAEYWDSNGGGNYRLVRGGAAA